MRILVAGSAIVDLIVRPNAGIRHDASNDARITWSAGGAGRNVAENLARLGAAVTLVTDVADDVPGRFMLEDLRERGIEVRLSARARTGIYVAILHARGTLDFGLCQTGTEHVGRDQVAAAVEDLESFDAVVVDANLNAAAVEMLADRCRRARIPYALETAAPEKSRRVVSAIPGCALVKPDRPEAAALAGLPCGTEDEAAACAEALVAGGAERVLVSLGADGLVFASRDARAVLPALPTTVMDVTGAGDAMLAAAFFGLLNGMPPARYLEAGRRAAALTCASAGAVSPSVGPQVFDP